MTTEVMTEYLEDLQADARFARTCCDSPADRMWHAADNTWWRREGSRWVAANPPSAIACYDGLAEIIYERDSLRRECERLKAWIIELRALLIVSRRVVDECIDEIERLRAALADIEDYTLGGDYEGQAQSAHDMREDARLALING